VADVKTNNGAFICENNIFREDRTVLHTFLVSPLLKVKIRVIIYTSTFCLKQYAVIIRKLFENTL
jgi:hypothetical protein